MAQPILELRELSKFYVNGQNVVAGLSKINISFERGEFVAITGESGSGKSSLAHILGGILPYEDGDLLFCGKPTSHYDSQDWENYRAESVGFISQSYGILPGATVLENVVSALRLTGMDKELATQEAKSILEEVELWPLRKRRAAKLSSGQKQRLSIARALAKPCAILIADEPTGNLDPENSDKVIRLLAKAAEDRLVILITHEFSECENYVTRHISLQDGRICTDVRMGSHPNVEKPMPRRKSAGDMSRYIAALQIKSRPAWSMIVALFMMLTAFAVFVFLGSFIVATDDTSTRIYQNSVFLNGEKTRLVVEREDQQPMTQEDYDKLLSLRHVTQLEQFGYIQDVYYAYQEGVDYQINYVKTNAGSFRRPTYIETSSAQVLTEDQFMKTVPLMDDMDDFLTGGVLPAQFNEVVATDEALLGKTLTVYLRNEKQWEDGGYICLEVKVVGITDLGSGLYFHEDVGRTMTLDYLGAEFTYIPMYSQIPSEVSYTNYYDPRSMAMSSHPVPFHVVMEPTNSSVMRDMQDTEMYVSLTGYQNILLEGVAADYPSISRHAYTTQHGTWSVVGLHNSTLSDVVAVTPAAFQRILTESGIGNGEQVGLTISDYAYTQRVMDALQKEGYYALSPYVLGSAKIDSELAAQRQQTLYICIGALMFILVLQLIVLKAMFNMQSDSFRTLSDLGLTCQTAQRSIFWQMLLFTLIGQMLAYAAVWVCSRQGISQITSVTKYLYGIWWAAISVIHLVSTMLSAWFIAAGLKKSVYPRTARKRDLVIDEEEEAVQ